MTMTRKRHKAERARARRAEKAGVADLLSVADAISGFVAWLTLAGEPSKQAFRIFIAAEVRPRLARMESRIAGKEYALPASARDGLASVRAGLADDLKECKATAASRMSLGVFVVREWERLAALISLLAKEAGESKAPPAPKR